MWELIEASLTSDILFVRARGIALLGFSSDSRAEETLQSLIHTLPDTWLRWQVAERSLRLFDTNRWAKHWFRRFFEVEDDVIAWSSFRLFLKCVDSRFAQWKSDVMREVVKHERTESRKVFLEINNGDIKNSIRDNEKDLREKFLGHKILERQAWPWF